MSPARLVPSIALVLLLPACGHPVASARAPAEPGSGGPAFAQAHPAEDVESAPGSDAAGGQAGASQTITFGEDDVESEPTTQIRSAPKRPPIPSFELFGTRKGDGP